MTRPKPLIFITNHLFSIIILRIQSCFTFFQNHSLLLFDIAFSHILDISSFHSFLCLRQAINVWLTLNDLGYEAKGAFDHHIKTRLFPIKNYGWDGNQLTCPSLQQFPDPSLPTFIRRTFSAIESLSRAW